MIGKRIRLLAKMSCAYPVMHNAERAMVLERIGKRLEMIRHDYMARFGKEVDA
jgi:tRNA 2-selenouridine synthase SelU